VGGASAFFAYQIDPDQLIPLSIILDHKGAEVARVPGRRRVYLERDTADFYPNSQGYTLVFDLAGPSGSVSNVDVVASVAGSGSTGRWGFVAVAPDASHAVANVGYWSDVCTRGFRAAITTVRGAVQVVKTLAEQTFTDPSEECGGDPAANSAWPTAVAWSHDSQRALAIAGYDDAGFKLMVGTETGPVVSATVAGWYYVDSPRFAADDSTFDVTETRDDACQRTRRRTALPSTVLDTTPGFVDEFFTCDLQRPSTIPNAPTHQRLAAGRSAFDLFSIARGLPRRSRGVVIQAN
jgi:hypothetical protein